jgi:hypothetical protein
MQRLIRKVTCPPPLVQDACSSTDFTLLTHIALTAKLEVAKKALAEEKAARQIANQSLPKERAAQLVADQSLQASQEASATLTRVLQSAQASIVATKEKLSSKSVALDESVIRESEAQIKL